MPKGREIKTCGRCRQLKLRCDRTKPSCRRCTEAHVSCSFLVVLSTPTTGIEPPTSETETATETLTPSSIADLPLLIPLDEQPIYLDSSRETSVEKLPSVAKKRRRAHLSCIRCYRLKVKCDRELPCSRCRLSGWSRHCAYNHRVENTPSFLDTRSQVSALGEEEPGRIHTSWHTEHRSASHWKELLSKVIIQS